MSEITRIEIPVYIRTVEMSKARLKKYYEKGKKKVPKKYDNDCYEWKKRGTKTLLYNRIDQDFVIANPRVHGTPKIEIINGQAIYNGYISKWSRAKMMREIKNSFQDIIETMPVIKQFPIRIVMEIHDLVTDSICSNMLWDLGNRGFTYMKKFEDCLSGNKHHSKPTTKQIIEDDNVLFITGLKYQFIPIDGLDQERKLVFIIEKEDDTRVIDHPKYKK